MCTDQYCLLQKERGLLVHTPACTISPACTRRCSVFRGTFHCSCCCVSMSCGRMQWRGCEPACTPSCEAGTTLQRMASRLLHPSLPCWRPGWSRCVPGGSRGCQQVWGAWAWVSHAAGADYCLYPSSCLYPSCFSSCPSCLSSKTSHAPLSPYQCSWCTHLHNHRRSVGDGAGAAEPAAMPGAVAAVCAVPGRPRCPRRCSKGVPAGRQRLPMDQGA